MKEFLRQFAVYNIWANSLLKDVIIALPEEIQLREIPSSFGSLHKTILHMWDAESTWWQRTKLQERIIIQSEGFTGNTKQAFSGLLHQNQEWNEFIINAQERQLQHELIYRNSKREQFKQPVFQILLHIFNHGSYHRGQLVNMLRQLGVDKIPQTDFIVWSRKK
ncbi:MAG TPA: DinB family protein [Chitinophagaceae bacterium]|nr:DinB family protein [Chitinophagaceae bacterium]